MTDSMRCPLTKRYMDRSTMDGFSFSFYCDRCSKEWRSVRYDFNPGSFVTPSDSAVYQMLWNDQHKAAYARAIREGALAFNLCPVCGCKVCQECFYLSEIGMTDVCTDCFKTSERS